MTEPRPLPPLARAFLLAGLAFFALAALRFGAALLVPLIEAFLVCFVLNAAANAMRRLPVVGRRVPFAVALLLCAAIAFAIGFWVVQNSGAGRW
jgi:predicted PurR-regulated permease PerM